MLYHRELGLPKSISELIDRTFRLNFSTHSLKACLNDRYGKITPPQQITIQQDDIVEVETGEHGIEKVVVRQSYNDDFDICMALIPEGTTAFVKTCWLNEKGDAHETLDQSKYFHPN